MILEDATHEAFGYYSKDLLHHSGKLILAYCDICGEFKVTTKNDYHTFCNSCSHKGKTFTEEWKRKMSEALKGDKHPQWKGGKVERVCKVCGKTFFGRQNQVKNGYGNYCSCSCSTKALTLENSHNWKGGISFEPYCIKFNNAYKESIRELFDRKCFLCGNTEEDNGRKLDVHHVNYNKECGCDGSKCVCVPLCRSCHMKTNGDRDYWQALIMEMLKLSIKYL